MIKIIYNVAPQEKEAELDWLREQKVFPAVQLAYDWRNSKEVIQFGMIVPPETALLVKLRHKLDLQTDWRQR